MLLRELKVNFKSFLIWLLILVVMFLFVYLIYPFIITDEAIASVNALLEAFPEEVLKAFNMDIASIESAYGWFKSEGLLLILLVIGFYSANLGMKIVLKEQSDLTIEYLSFLPIRRRDIFIKKVLVSLIYIFSMVIILAIFNLIALSISGEVDFKQLFLLSISPLFIALPLFSLCLFISMFLRKTKAVVGISLGILFVSYFFNIFSEISDKIEFMKYFSLFTLADIRHIISTSSMNTWCIIISLVLAGAFGVGAYFMYEKKELI